MIPWPGFRCAAAAALASVLFLTGCAARLPSSVPVAASLREEVLAGYRSFRQDRCSGPVDADISLDVEAFGSDFRARGILQIKPPGRLRLTITDPVGRPLFFLAATDDEFTLVNSLEAEVLVGGVSALAGGGHVPGLTAAEAAGLLTGRFAPPAAQLSGIRRESGSAEQFRLVFHAGEGLRHNIDFAPGPGRILRHAVTDGSGILLLDIRYGTAGEGSDGCALPDILHISGEAVGGRVRMVYERVVPEPEIPDSIFRLSFPEHYRIRRAE